MRAACDVAFHGAPHVAAPAPALPAPTLANTNLAPAIDGPPNLANGVVDPMKAFHRQIEEQKTADHQKNAALWAEFARTRRSKAEDDEWEEDSDDAAVGVGYWEEAGEGDVAAQ